jgi:hypothetical protein
MECIKIINAQQAKSTYVYRNTKQELLKKNASFWFSRTCQMNHLTSKCMNITINDNSQQKFYPIILISILWSNLTHLVTLYPSNRNVTLKMAELLAKSCRWKYHYTNTPVELSAYCWFLIHIIQINVRNMECIKIRKIPFFFFVTVTTCESITLLLIITTQKVWIQNSHFCGHLKSVPVKYIFVIRKLEYPFLANCYMIWYQSVFHACAVFAIALVLFCSPEEMQVHGLWPTGWLSSSDLLARTDCSYSYSHTK